MSGFFAICDVVLFVLSVNAVRLLFTWTSQAYSHLHRLTISWCFCRAAIISSAGARRVLSVFECVHFCLLDAYGAKHSSSGKWVGEPEGGTRGVLRDFWQGHGFSNFQLANINEI